MSEAVSHFGGRNGRQIDAKSPSPTFEVAAANAGAAKQAALSRWHCVCFAAPLRKSSDGQSSTASGREDAHLPKTIRSAHSPNDSTGAIHASEEPDTVFGRAAARTRSVACAQKFGLSRTNHPALVKDNTNTQQRSWLMGAFMAQAGGGQQVILRTSIAEESRPGQAIPAAR